jgi:hypothetical protein
LVEETVNYQVNASAQKEQQKANVLMKVGGGRENKRTKRIKLPFGVLESSSRWLMVDGGGGLLKRNLYHWFMIQVFGLGGN